MRAPLTAVVAVLALGMFSALQNPHKEGGTLEVGSPTTTTMSAGANHPKSWASSPRVMEGGAVASRGGRIAPVEAHRSMVRPSLPWPASTVLLLTQDVTLAAPSTAAPFPPAVTLSRSAPATDYTSPNATPSRSVATRSPEVRGGEAATSGSTAQQWHRLAVCESSDEPHNKQNALYRGWFQIGYVEWREYGGVGTDPADASPAEQLAVALRLWQARGWEPWASSEKCTRLR